MKPSPDSDSHLGSFSIPSLMEIVREEESAIDKLLEAEAADDIERIKELLQYIRTLRTSPSSDDQEPSPSTASSGGA